MSLPQPARAAVGLPRRGALLALAAGGLTLTAGGVALTGCAALRQHAPAERGAPQAADEGRWRRLAPGVFMLPGMPGAASAGNRGRVGNLGLLVGPAGAMLVDTGTSWAQGAQILAFTAAASPVPLRLALVSHTRPEFLFGAGALRARGVPVAMHAATARLMTSRCDQCLRNLHKEVGEAEMRGTAMYTPDLRVEEAAGSPAETSEMTRLARQATGRAVRVLHFGHSSGPGDLAVFDEASGVLFAGGLADHQRVPDIQDARLPAWEAALATLAGLPGLKQVVGGHGPAGGPEVLRQTADYLRQLQAHAVDLVARGLSLLEAGEAADLPAFRHWDRWQDIHPRNASIAYLQAEQAAFLKP